MPRRAESQVTLASRSGTSEKAMQMEIQQVPWWNKRTRMERRGMVIVGTLLVISVSLAVGVVLLAKGPHDKFTQRQYSKGIVASKQTTAAFTADVPKFNNLPVNNKDYCFEKGCILAAADLLENINTAIDPCDNFYDFACGGFVEKTLIPDDRTRTSRFSVLGDTLNEQVRGLLEGDIKEEDPKPFQMAKKVYQSCMDTETIEKIGLEPLKQVLRNMGGWPLLEDTWALENDFKWYEMMYKFREYGFSVDYLVDFSVTTDLKNSSWRVLDLDQPGLGMSREYLMKGVNDADVQAYYEYMVDVAMLMGADEQTAKSQMLDTLNFEIQIANITLKREDRRDASKLYNPMTIGDLSTLDASTPWLQYINKLLTKDIIQVDSSEVIIVDVPSYIINLSSLLSVTPARTQANYLMWRAAAACMSYMTEQADKIGLKFSKKLTGKSQQPPRWRRCVGAASGSLSNAVGSLYVSKYFKEDSKSAALEMVADIRAKFSEMLDTVEWMDDNTRQKAKQKAEGMVEHIGYPPELLDMKKLEDLYDGLEVVNDEYLGNALNMTVFGTNYAFSKLKEKVNKTDWIRHGRPAVVNAFYSPLENSIQFPAGILQGIFFSNDRPRYLNYGAIGWVIGHEITHGFDDQGRQFDIDGNLVDWWDPQTKSRYLQKAKCIIEQYGNYTIPELDNLPLNGINTQGENIADNGGIKEAYRAYNSWVQRNGAEKLLPGLNYNQKQLFWVSAANVWCAKYRPKALKLRVLTGVHSPDMFRVQGPFSNQEEFAADWGCPVGSNMNPQKSKKCEVW